MTAQRPLEERWRGRPALAAALRLFVMLAPLGGALGVSILMARLLPPANGTAHLVAHWIGTLAASTIALILTDRAARRLLPLAVLWQLSLAFPKEAPSRFAVARRALNTRELQERIEAARREGVNSEPIRVAADMLALIAAVESHDRHTRGHSERVRVLTDLISEEMHLPERDRDRLRWAALLHDVGKLEVPGAILNKPGKLTKEEWRHIHRHPRVGARLVAPMKTWLGDWAAAVEQHHERYDGKGYPNGLAGSQISLAGRIVAVADSFETMTGARPYRRPMSAAAAREELVACAGEQFDPHVVRAFLQVSVKRLSLATGPLAWAAQTPILMGLGQAVGAVGRSLGTAAAAGGAMAIAVAPVVAGPAGGAGVPDKAAAVHASADAGEDDSGSKGSGEGSDEDPDGGSGDPDPSPSPSPSPSHDPRDPIIQPTPSPGGPSGGMDPTPSPTPTPPADPGPGGGLGPNGNPGKGAPNPNVGRTTTGGVNAGAFMNVSQGGPMWSFNVCGPLVTGIC